MRDIEHRGGRPWVKTNDCKYRAGVEGDQARSIFRYDTSHPYQHYPDTYHKHTFDHVTWEEIDPPTWVGREAWPHLSDAIEELRLWWIETGQYLRLDPYYAPPLSVHNPPPTSPAPPLGDRCLGEGARAALPHDLKRQAARFRITTSGPSCSRAARRPPRKPPSAPRAWRPSRATNRRAGDTAAPRRQRAARAPSYPPATLRHHQRHPSARLSPAGFGTSRAASEVTVVI